MTIREKSIDWYYQLTRPQQIDLKNKYFSDKLINFSEQWGFHFTFGQIDEMYLGEHKY